MFLSVLNFLLLKKCKGLLTMMKYITLREKLNLRHTTLENKLHNRAHSKATDTVCSIKLKREEFIYIRTIFN